MESFNNQNILVVGGAGFVGSNLVKYILSHSVCRQFTIVDNLLSAEKENIPNHEKVRLIEGSIVDDAVLAEITDRFGYVFHLATFHGNQNSIFDPLADHKNNTLTSLKLFNHIKEFKTLKKLVYSSAGCAVAEKTFDTVTATSEDAPVSLYMDSPYSMSKIFGEFYGNYFFQQYGMPFVKARFQNVYGPGEILGAGRWRGTPATVWRNVIPTFIYKAIDKQALPVENGGIATRDFIYVDDIVHGLVACAIKGKPGEVYNLASGQETTILELAQKINDFTGNSTPIALKPKREWDHSGKRFGNPQKAIEKLGFETLESINSGLQKTIAWSHENWDLIMQTIQKHKSHLHNLND